ncbi:TACC1 protein, partial [Brachypodius atriceps]|nr:TACC1 protein [Brachypodius atriceps]
MAFSAWQILSPVQWARWTWSAVRGGGSPEEGDGGAEEDDEEEDQDPPEKGPALGFRQTPEAETPTCSPLKEFCEPPGSPEPEAGTQGKEPACQALPQTVSWLHSKYSSTGFVFTGAFSGASRQRLLGGSFFFCSQRKHFCHLREDSDPHDSFSWLLASWGSIMLTTSHQLSQDWESDPDNSPLMQPLARLGCKAEPGHSPVPTVQPAPLAHVGTAPWEQVMPGGDTADTGTALVELRADAPAQEQQGKGKIPSLGRKTEETQASSQLDPEQRDRSVTPFVAEPCQLQSSAPAAPRDPALEAPGQVPKPGADFTEARESVEAKPASPRRGSRIPASKLTPKRHRQSPKKPAEDVERGPTEPPPPRGCSQPGPTSWDSPGLNSLSGSSALQNSPVLPKGSYQFDPNNFDSMDPFKPTKTLASTDADPCSTADNSLNEILESQTLEMQEDALKGRDSPRKPKSRLITSGCKVKQHEAQPLALDSSTQDEGVLISEIPDITNRDGRATDEEKLASTTSMQKPSGLEKKAEPEDDLEYFECSNIPTSAAKHRPETGEEHPIAFSSGNDNPGLCSMDKCPSSESPLAGICLSESEKAAVLTLIREEIIAKEIEANEWKKKYEESRQEVLEMRKIVAEYEKTIAQMIEDEQRTNMTSQKNLQQLTMEKDQALADLNSVERSLSDLFRRYENLKGVLEGFKKNEEALKKCAQDYLTRVKQEEQRYQALKVHAEEKLDKANEEIAQVRTKAKAESAALHAGLRKEQMKVESLERTLQQK